LSDAEIVVGRAETIGRNAAYRERYDVAIARAVAELRVLAEYCLPFCRIGGRFLAPKGAQSDNELIGAQKAIDQLGGRLIAVEDVDLPGVERRVLVVVEKVAPTPPQYPRAVGIPAKRPL
jgi:16S rRNA (guanine527-N7)-methyltransferase